MPIPSVEKGEKTDEYLSRCMKAISGEYGREQAYAICQSKVKDRQMSENVFVLSPKKSESRGLYITRCSKHGKIREQFPNLKERMSHCLGAFNSYYKYWSRLEEFGSEEHPDVKFEGCMSKYKASGKDYKEAYSTCMAELLVEPVAMENMDTAIGDCIAKRMKEDSSLTHEEARKRCSASVVVQPVGGTNPNVAVQMADYPWDQCISDMMERYGDEETAKKVCGAIKAQNQSAQFADCPPATQDIKKNLSNRQKAIDEANYGPLDPNQPNEEYWKKKATQFKTSVEEAKNALCANCGFFNQTKPILDCIAEGIGTTQGEPDPYDTIKAGDVGYCEAFDFKCAGMRTCDAWLAGGPIK